MNALVNGIPTGEGSRRLGVSDEQVRRLIALGRLVAVRTRLGYLIDPASLEEEAARRQAGKERA